MLSTMKDNIPAVIRCATNISTMKENIHAVTRRVTNMLSTKKDNIPAVIRCATNISTTKENIPAVTRRVTNMLSTMKENIPAVTRRVTNMLPTISVKTDGGSRGNRQVRVLFSWKPEASRHVEPGASLGRYIVLKRLVVDRGREARIIPTSHGSRRTANEALERSAFSASVT
ncbi:hypothetical protein LSAT2_031911, partial [Lamellibrachia satsuma]